MPYHLKLGLNIAIGCFYPSLYQRLSYTELAFELNDKRQRVSRLFLFCVQVFISSLKYPVS